VPAGHADQGGPQRRRRLDDPAVRRGILMIIVVDAVFAVLTYVLHV
jgi:hypothetical protein